MWCVCVCLRPLFLYTIVQSNSIEHELTKWAEMSTKNFCTNDAIYLRFELNYYTEIVDLNKVQFLFWAFDSDGRVRVCESAQTYFEIYTLHTQT